MTENQKAPVLNKENLEVKGIRAIAVFEAAKGILGIIVGIALFSLMHKDLTVFAENLIHHLHFDPSGEMAQKVIETAGKVDDSNIILVICLCGLYVTVRFVEAYGLWFLKAWAEWFAIISGCIYIPVEIYELFHKPTFVRAGILLINFGIVAYLYYFRREHKIEDEQIHESVVPTDVQNPQ